MDCRNNLAGSKTAQNLAKAFAGECQARTRYLFYSETANSEGYPTLQQIFLETADNERGHAEIFYDYLTSGLKKQTMQTQALVPIALGTTSQNLVAAAEGEHEEWTKLYPSFAREAEQEGFKEIAVSFTKIASVEKRHDARYTYLLERLKRNMLYSLPYESMWICTNCGLYVKGKKAPDICPACHHSQPFYMDINDETYPYDPCQKPKPCDNDRDGHDRDINDSDNNVFDKRVRDQGIYSQPIFDQGMNDNGGRQDCDDFFRR